MTATRSITHVKSQPKRAKDMIVLIREEKDCMMKESAGMYWSEIGEHPGIGF